ncbi:YhcN/YlaJ family sporulation lipoprotein [Irregularibacter muris]|uniref:YhcN/YlaJ family sporulation lipoprotein n=1 Tax=Irregularibacter muris TaxID=1796619 RepID=A0AAE3HIW3_9FIRM|nr:YhcN/YlaJ family sporulation lipoprotein [Irregularibacter muris]MCR1899498.1 YhcN/YlaJ family sporulation lipoprotein [Irregularibacter muris]
MKRVVLLSIIFLLVGSLIVGCAPARRVNPDNNVQNAPNNQRNANPDNMIPNNQDNVTPRDNTTVPNNTPRNNTTENNVSGDDTARARRVADVAKDVDGVRDATVVVNGNTAYVGIDINANIQDNATDQLKERVGDIIKDKEATINRVYVSADSDTVTRLKDVARDVENGRPISGFIDQLTEMFRRPAPSVQ